MAANKLNAAGRDLVVARIIAGDTNSQIRNALAKAGHEFDLVDSTLSIYRRRDDVKRRRAEAMEEEIQQGTADRRRRIAVTREAIDLNLLYLLGGVDENGIEVEPDRGGMSLERMTTHCKLMETMAKLAGDADNPVIVRVAGDPASSPVKVEVEAEVTVKGYTKGMVADALESYADNLAEE